MKGIRILWSPGRAADAAAGSLWAPLAILGVAATFADYPLLLRLTSAGLAQAKLDHTPQGLTSFSILVFLGLRWAAPVLLPLGVLVTGRFLGFYLNFFLDNKVEQAGVSRITAWGMLPLAVERILNGVVTMACGASCDRFNPVATNLAFWFDPRQTEAFWYEMAKGLDLFTAWAVWSVSAALSVFAEDKPSRIWPGIVALWTAALLLRSLLLD